MDKLLTEHGGESHFLLGNEAIVRGALEAGVGLATTYPGTPSSEIGNTLHKLAKQTDRYYFEFSTNEKVALEVSGAAAVSGVRTLCFMKHVGVNVAADSFMSMAYLGVKAGMVIVTADDPGCHSSQNEQDNREYARLALMPMLEPTTPQEAHRMVREAFDLSEELELPVLLRTTTRVNHMRGIVPFGDLPKTVKKTGHFDKDSKRFVIVPAVARARRNVLLGKLSKGIELSDASPMNPETGNGDLGIITSGVAYNYVMDALSELGVSDRIRVLKLGFSFPLPENKIVAFLGKVKRCLVVEEVEPVVENDVAALTQRSGVSVDLVGKAQGWLSRQGEFTPEQVTAAVARLADVPYEAPRPSEADMTLPSRPPNLCPGCPHRSTYYASRLVTRGNAIYNSDIGCYTLGVLPPLEMADLVMSMGASVNMASGMSVVEERPAIAFIGDSTFFHSGIPGLINAVHNKHRMVLVILDNSTTAMTGHQPHPGNPIDGMQQPAPSISIEAMCKAAGVNSVQTINAFELKAGMAAFRSALEQDGVSVIISRGACIFVDRPRLEKRPAFEVDHDKCMFCGLYQNHEGCTETINRPTQMTRAIVRIDALKLGSDAAKEPLPPKPEVAPCTWRCPAHLCVQSYITLIRAGKYSEAAKAVRDRIPLPAVIARVCHRPCEQACTRTRYDRPVAINALKRFAMEHEDTEEVATELRKAVAEMPKRGKTVAVIGAGPAGLTAAHDLRLRGYDVELFEAAPVPGGLLALGIPAYRLPRDVLKKEIDLILSLGITLHLNTRVGTDVAFADIQRRFNAIVAACGTWKGSRLGVAGEDAQGVFDALGFLKAVNLDEKVEIGKRVVVVGAGDAAMDAARVARRLGASQVTIAYRRSEREMPAAKDEIVAATDEGVTFEFLASPVEVLGRDGKVSGLKLVRNELGEKDASGRKRPIPVEGSEFEMACDTVIVAVGQRAQVDYLPAEVERTKWGTIATDKKTAATSLEGVFAAGDVATGPDTVIAAIAAGQDAAAGIDAYLSSGLWEVRPNIGRHLDDEASVVKFLYEPSGLIERPRTPMPEAPAKDRVLDFREVELGLSERDALTEAARCTACGSCAKCRICVDTFACPAFYIENGFINIDDTLCVGCGVCAQLCPNDAILPKNV